MDGIIIKSGDRYRVKTYAVNEMPEHWVSDMRQYMGRKMTIADVVIDNDFGQLGILLVNGGGWYFEDCDFEGLNILELDDGDFLL